MLMIGRRSRDAWQPEDEERWKGEYRQADET
jgi:hypothetical protein